MCRLCPLTEVVPSAAATPIFPSPPTLPISSCYDIISRLTMSSPPTSQLPPTSSCMYISPILSSTMSTDVKLDDDGFSTAIRWTLIGRVGKKSLSIQHKEFEGRYSGISQTTNKTIHTAKIQASTKNITADTSMRKEEEKSANVFLALV